MQVTEEGLDLIRQWEGFRREAYRDPVGVWTIGFGHTSAAGAPFVKAGGTITEAEGEAMLARDVARFAGGVAKCVKVSLSDAQFSALVSFAYNVGLGAFSRSGVLMAVNAGDFAAVPRRLGLWNKAGGRVLPGLVKRRAAEAAMFCGQASALPPAPVDVPIGKPVLASKTLWGSLAVALLSLLQAALSAHGGILTIIVLAAVLTAIGFIMHERLLKWRWEGL